MPRAGASPPWATCWNWACHSAGLHAGLAQPIRQAGIDLVFTCGPEMAALDAALPGDCAPAVQPTPGQLGALVAERALAGDVVLVKGSAGAKMGQVVAALDALDQSKGPNPGSQEGGHAS